MDDKIEIFTFRLMNKSDKEPIKFHTDFLNEIFDKLKKELPEYINSFSPSKLDTKTVKIGTVDKMSDSDELIKETLFKFSKKFYRLEGIFILGKDADKVFNFTKATDDKENAGKKNQGVNIDTPHYFQILFKENEKQGFLVFERTLNKTCKGVFTKILQQFLNEKYGTIKLETENFIEQTLYDNYLKKGHYNSVTFTKKGISGDNTKSENLEKYIEKGSYKLETKLIPEGDFIESFKQRVVDSLENKDYFFTIPELNELGYDGDHTTLKINSKFGGKSRTIDLSNVAKVRPVYNLDKVDKGSDGYSDFESIRKEVNEFLYDLNIGLY